MESSDIPTSVYEEKEEAFTPSVELEFESIISKILLIGVILSGSLMIIGFFLTITTDYSLNLSVVTVGWIFSQFFQLTPIGILFMGIFILLLTPVTRVAASILLYISIKDWKYVVFTTLVLIFMLLGVILGVK